MSAHNGSHHHPAESSTFARIMEPVARELLGEPTATHRGKRELRWGARESLKVDLDKGTWHDFETGTGGGVLDLVQDRESLDKPSALAWLRERGHLPRENGADRTRKAEPKPSRTVATYDYADASAGLLFQACRCDPKSFKQRRPDGEGGWTWNLDGVPLVLYRLPELIAAVAAGATIYIPEGEKDVHSLARLGFAATCNPMGAGKWRAEYGRWLTGADVVILPDNDPQSVRNGKPQWHPDGRPVLPGPDHAADIAKSLQGIAARVRVLDLPDLAPKGDVSDWIEAGGTAEQLAALANMAPDGEAWLRDRLPPEAVSVADYLSTGWRTREFAPPVRLLGDLVTSTSRTFLVGATGLGKTMLGLAMAAGMATGTGFLDLKCDRPARILYVDGEMPGELVRTRMEDALRRTGREDLGRNLFIYSLDEGEKTAAAYPQLGIMEPLNTDAGRGFILRLIEAIGGVDAVIFDNVMSLIAGDQKDEVPWSETLPLVAELTRRNIGQVWFDHAGHNADRQYGSSTKAWRFDAVGIMTKLPEDEQAPRETAFKLSFDAPGKARRRTPDNWDQFAPRTIRLADDQWAGAGAEAPRGKADRDKMPDETKVLLREIHDALARGEGAMARPMPDMPEVPTLKRKTLRAVLIRSGWLRLSEKLSEKLSGTESLPQQEMDRLWKRLIELKVLGKIGFNRHDLWLPERQ